MQVVSAQFSLFKKLCSTRLTTSWAGLAIQKSIKYDYKFSRAMSTPTSQRVGDTVPIGDGSQHSMTVCAITSVKRESVNDLRYSPHHACRPDCRLRNANAQCVLWNWLVAGVVYRATLKLQINEQTIKLGSVTGRRQLPSSDIDTCLARTNTRLGDRSFAAAGPRVWTSLSTQLRESDITLGQFRRALKAHIFG